MNLENYKTQYKEQIAKLDGWAQSVGARLICGEPWQEDEIELFPTMIQPFFGTLSFSIPRSYHAFLSVCSSIKLEVNWEDEKDPDWSPPTNLCWIYHPDETINARGWILIPEGVSNNDNRLLTTNHLWGFSAANDISDTHWCFITDEPNEEGELPVLLHNTNDLNAVRFLETAEYVHPELVKREYQSFADWLNAYVDELIKMDKNEFESIF